MVGELNLQSVSVATSILKISLLKANPKFPKLLKETTINFSINDVLDNSQICAQKILQYHPETVQLEVLREDFPEIWQQTIK